MAPRPLKKPVALLPCLGIWTHPSGNAHAQAQKFFDRAW